MIHLQRQIRSRLGFVLITWTGLWASTAGLGHAGDWLKFRGSDSCASSDEETVLPGENGIPVSWQVPTAARGISSPIVIGDQVVVTSSGGREERDLYIESFNTTDGSRNWVQTFSALGRPYTHPTSANASPSPASDGNAIVALYSSCDLVCLELDGTPRWYRALAVDHPQTGNDISMSSSPTIVDDVVIVQLENQGDSFATGIDVGTGVTLWETRRPSTSGWSSPVGFAVPDSDGAPRRVVAFQHTAGVSVHDVRTGDLVTQIDIEGSKTCSPTISGDTLLVVGNGLTALDVSSPGLPVIWENSRLSCRNASPVVRDGMVFACKGSVLVAASLIDGEVHWQERMPDVKSVWATPTATASGVYVWDQSGAVSVAVPDGFDEPDMAGSAELTGPVLATPAVSSGSIFVRANEALIKLSAS
ncbi:MAG: PQQ-binding-like beta-propeller repeat protein [Planctomycetota bacterium]